MGIRYYQEKTGDYMAVDEDSIAYYVRIGRPDRRECRATAIEGVPSSVCTTSTTVGFLKSCKEVNAADVPERWRRWLGLS